MGKVKASRIWTIPKTELQDIVTNSISISEVLRTLGLSTKGASNATRLKTRLDQDNIDCKTLVGKPRCIIHVKQKSLDEILTEHSTHSRSHLKKKLLKERLLENKCAVCGQLPIWENKKLVMILDHINGVPNDNRISNLRLLCPNCNSQTDTFAGKNRS